MRQQLLMFSSKFCGPCKIARPVIDNIVDECYCDFQYYSIDNDDIDQSLLEKYDIVALPTFIILNVGDEEEGVVNDFVKVIGWNADSELKIRNLLKESDENGN